MKVLWGVTLAAAALCLPAAACSATTAAPADTGALRLALAHRDLARVTVAGTGTALLVGPWVSAEGVGFAEARPAGAPGSEPVPNPIPLVRIEMVEVRVGSSTPVAVLGALVGAGFGLATASAVGRASAFGSSPSGGELGAAAAVCGIAGALLGVAIGAPIPRWKTVWPAPPSAVPGLERPPRSRGGRR